MGYSVSDTQDPDEPYRRTITSRSRFVSVSLAVFAASVLVLAGGAPAEELFVATDGNDGWSGTLPAPNGDRTDGPLATLARARCSPAVEAGGLKEPVRSWLRGGMYYLAEPLVFTPEDSGTEACPITYAAYPGETPIISGGQPITGWKKPAEGNIWTAEIPEVKAGDWYFHQLFVDGQRRIRARMPNEGYFLNEGPIEPLVDRTKARTRPQRPRWASASSRATSAVGRTSTT